MAISFWYLRLRVTLLLLVGGTYKQFPFHRHRWVARTIPSSSHFRSVQNWKEEGEHANDIIHLQVPPCPAASTSASFSQSIRLACQGTTDKVLALAIFILHSLLHSPSVFTYSWWGDCRIKMQLKSTACAELYGKWEVTN